MDKVLSSRVSLVSSILPLSTEKVVQQTKSWKGGWMYTFGGRVNKICFLRLRVLGRSQVSRSQILTEVSRSVVEATED